MQAESGKVLTILQYNQPLHTKDVAQDFWIVESLHAMKYFRAV